MKDHSSLTTAVSQNIKRLTQILLLALIYFAAGKASFAVEVSHTIVSLVVFAPEGFALAAAILLGRWVWPGILIGQFLLAFTNGLSWDTALGIGIVNSSEAVIGATLFNYFRINQAIDRVRDVIGLLLLSLLILQPYSAILGNLILWNANIIPSADFLTSCFSWGFANVMAQIIITPTLLALFHKPLPKNILLIEALPLFVITLLIGITLFQLLSITNPLVLFSVTLPLIIFVATRFSLATAMLGICALTMTTLYYTSQHIGAFFSIQTSKSFDLNIFLLGNALTALFIGASIAQRKVIELNLRFSDEALKSITQGVVITDKDQNILSINEGFTTITGYTQADVVGKNCRLLQGLNTNQKTTAEIGRSIKNLIDFSGEILNYRKNGDTFWNDLTITPIYNDQKKVIRFIGITKDITERKNLEIKTIETNKRLVLATQAIKFAAWEWNLITNDVLWDDQVFDFFGIDRSTPPDGIYKAWAARVAPEDLIFVEHLLQECLKNPDLKFEGKFRVTDPYEALRWIGMNGIIDYDEQGKPFRMIGMNWDITEAENNRLNLEKSLDETSKINRRFVLATQAIKFGIWDLDLTTFDLTWDQRQFDLMWMDPTTPSDSVYNIWRARTHPEDIVRVENLLQECIKNPDIKFEGKFRIISPRGELRWIGMGGIIDYDTEGKAVRMTGMNWDITKTTLAEQEVLNARLHLQSVIDAARSFSIISTDIYGFIKLFSTGAEVMLGYTAEEVVDKTSPALFHVEAEIITRGNELTKQYGRPIHGFDTFVENARRGLIETREWTYVRKDGSTLPVRLSVTAIFDSDGQTTGFLGIGNDISQEKLTLGNLAQAKDAAEQANKAKSQFLANMSHEIRTPMNAILGMLQLLENTDLNTRQKDYANKTSTAAKSLLIILNDILDFSKVEAGKMELEIRPFQIDQLLRDISVILATNIGEKNIELILSIDPKIPKSLLGDAFRLQQILLNLSGNAVKFTDFGEIFVELKLVKLRDQMAEIRFSIKDTGIGIAPDQLEKIFEGFSQAESSTTRRFGGTGLGLAISKTLVELMGGSLQVESELGIGTEFIFTLHLPIDEKHATINQLYWLPNLPTDRPLNVLIVDDNASARLVLSSMATSIGWINDCAASGTEALKLIEARNKSNNAYDIIFIDWKMPDLDGWQTSEKIRELTINNQMPIIIMVTAHGRELMAMRMAENNATLNGFLIKPITPSMLFDAVADATSGQSSTPITEQTTSSSKRLKDLRILVVEDNLMNQQIADELLTAEGAIVDLAINGRIGIEKIINASPEYDVVLMDLQMPDMDGYTATKKIRRLTTNQLPIIAMTANVMSSDKAACLAAGMNDHIGKPIDLDLLVNTLLFYCGKTTNEEFQQSKSAVNLFQRAKPQKILLDQEADSAIDLDAALQRIGGNCQLFIRLIHLFINDTKNMVETLKTHLSNKDSNHAADLMHTLKSLAATVGASQLADFSSRTEKTLRKNPETYADTIAQSQLINALQDELAQSIALLNKISAQLLALQQPEQQLSKNQDNEAILNLLSDLDTLLTTGNMRATRIFLVLKQQYGLALADKLNPLEESLNQLDFKRALDHSRLLRKELS